MADMLRAGQEWLANQLKAHASRTVVYLRGANQTSVTAIIGRTLMKLEDGYGGIHMQWTDRDFLVPPEELVLAGSQILPERGSATTSDPIRSRVSLGLAAPTWKTCRSTRQTICRNCVNSPAF